MVSKPQRVLVLASGYMMRRWVLRMKELWMQGVDAAHLREMVQDKGQGGKEKRIGNSVNICDATPLMSQTPKEARAGFITDLG